MKKILLSVFMAVLATAALAQGNRANDFGKIVLSAYVPEDASVPQAARGILENKLNQIITESGISGSLDERFIITAVMSTMGKEIVSSGPTLIAYSFDITFYIGDGIAGNKFSSTTLNVKGVGENETKAHISALKSINTKNAALASFVEQGKAKIKNYYDAKCEVIIADANALAGQGKYDEAFYKLSSVPEISSNCYSKARALIVPIYKKYIEKNCQKKLSEAKALWAASQDTNGATDAAAIISEIDVSASCHKEAMLFVKQMEARIKERENKAWTYIYNQQKLDADVAKAAYNAAAAYANKRQSTTVVYNVKGWW